MLLNILFYCVIIVVILRWVFGDENKKKQQLQNAEEKAADKTIVELISGDNVVCYLDARGVVQYYEISSSSEQVGYYIDAAFKQDAFTVEGRVYIYSE